jgi:hypothetical protein
MAAAELAFDLLVVCGMVCLGVASLVARDAVHGVLLFAPCSPWP